MMNTIKHNIRIVLVAIVLLGNASAVNATTFYPNFGTLYYDGVHYLESYFLWTNPGSWSNKGVGLPAYEHDLKISPSYFLSCTTFTNLPDAYDDCWTAGVDEGGDRHVFSFGTFDATKIAGNRAYWGAWRFPGHGPAATSPVTLIGQRGYRRPWCPLPDNNIWCMLSDGDMPLLDLTMQWLGAPTTFRFVVP